MTTCDLIAEFARERLPGIVHDIVRDEMRDLLKQIEIEHAAWICAWCGYRNIRLNAGLDHCSVCGAETVTQFAAAGELHVRYTRNPKHAKSRARRSPHLDCVAIAGCKSSSTTYTSQCGTTN